MGKRIYTAKKKGKAEELAMHQQDMLIPLLLSKTQAESTRADKLQRKAKQRAASKRVQKYIKMGEGNR